LYDHYRAGPTLFNIVEAWLERIPFLSDEETGFEYV
jgi:hypothetical protein